MNIREELNESQWKAVEYCDGPSLVIAGAGSGKTRVLTYKIAYLLQQGMEPYHILALTFTNKAAREMRTRIGKLVGEELASQLWMGTFHSIFARILRIESKNINYEPNFTIYDESDSKSLAKRIIKEMGLDDKMYKVGNVVSRISEAKNKLISPEAYENDHYARTRDDKAKMPALYLIYKNYCDRCRQANAMDFDDLLVNTFNLFYNNSEALARWAGKFRFVLVDEYQDTNFAQHQIILQLTHERQQVCVVGDDAQSIYSFRGANIDNILSFPKQYNNVQTFKLERNYRSTKRIVAAANALIKHNEKQIHKEVYSENVDGEPIEIKNAYSDKEEAAIVCRRIHSLLRSEGGTFADFAVLYRTNSQSRTFEEAMRKDNIPYRIYGGTSFYQRKEIKDVMAYFRLVCNPNDEEAFKRIINYPARGIGDATLNKIISRANETHVSLWDVICHEPTPKTEAFRNMIVSFIERLGCDDAYDLGKDIIILSGIKDDICSSSEPEDVTRQENLGEFINSLQEFVESRREEGRGDQTSLMHFVQEVALLTDADIDHDKDIPRVSLMTIHSAKGLEFPNVFIVGVEENIFPSPMSLDSPRQLEEERRLFYVAITRAERNCVITFAQNRWRYGKIEFGAPSRFLREIKSPPLSPQGARPGNYGNRELRNQGISKLPQSLTPHPSALTPHSSPLTLSSSLQPSMMIEHNRFGRGRVVKVEGEGEMAKATVEFRNLGTKQLLLKFAKFNIVDE